MMNESCTLERRDPRQLVPHPKNEETYRDYDSDEQDAELTDSIRWEGGVKNPIHILPAGNGWGDQELVISGSRRRRCAIEAGDLEVPVYVRYDLHDLADVYREIRVLNDKTREKTTEQKAREYLLKKEEEEIRAKARRVSGKKTEKKSTARKEAAKTVGLSENTALIAAEVVHKIDELEESGNQDEAKELRKTLNKNVREAGRKAGLKPKRTPATAPEERDMFKEFHKLLGLASKMSDEIAAAYGIKECPDHSKVTVHIEYASDAMREWQGKLPKRPRGTPF